MGGACGVRDVHLHYRLPISCDKQNTSILIVSDWNPVVPYQAFNRCLYLYCYKEGYPHPVNRIFSRDCNDFAENESLKGCCPGLNDRSLPRMTIPFRIHTSQRPLVRVTAIVRIPDSISLRHELFWNEALDTLAPVLEVGSNHAS